MTATPDRKSHTRRILRKSKVAAKKARRSIQREIKTVMTTGKGRERDIKKPLEEIAVASAGALPPTIAPIASAATRYAMRTWRLSYDDAVKSGVAGVLEGHKNMSSEDRRSLYSDVLIELAAGAIGGVAGSSVSGIAPSLSTPVGAINVTGMGAGMSAGMSTAKAIEPIAQKISRKIVKGDSYRKAFERYLQYGF